MVSCVCFLNYVNQNLLFLFRKEVAAYDLLVYVLIVQQQSVFLVLLQEIWFNVSTTVTLATVRLLLKQDNPLKCIGRLCHMAEATMGEYQELLAQVRQHNLDIKLIWVTDERIRK